jgi:hypothetical protein
LQLEAQTYERIHEKIQERVMNNLGTWIDWQYLQNAAKLLAKVFTISLFHLWSLLAGNIRVGAISERRGNSVPCIALHVCLWGHVSLCCR